MRISANGDVVALSPDVIVMTANDYGVSEYVDEDRQFSLSQERQRRRLPLEGGSFGCQAGIWPSEFLNIWR